eukprot:TRINITY_DN6084_c0_g1_i1.p2 TRINITY_DN6084_c0_g1~~TRINITY_DN6084_c0_g1_i1.p2  ORF type:complete len:170 (+),score=56.71 TRINITY_DN6084_c0_g1_i1:48-512(+)
MRVLLAVDDSPSAEVAYKQCVEFLKKSGEAHNVTVVSSPPVLSDLYALYTDPSMLQSVNKRVEANTHMLLKQYNQRLEDDGIQDHSFATLEGNAGEAICSYARESGAHLIVMGRSGSGMLKRMLVDQLGSTSAYVSQNSPCAVLVVRSRAESDE